MNTEYQVLVEKHKKKGNSGTSTRLQYWDLEICFCKVQMFLDQATISPKNTFRASSNRNKHQKEIQPI